MQDKHAADRKKKILIVTANPRDTSALTLAHELKRILEAIQRGRQRDFFDVSVCPAACIDSLRLALLNEEPQIVHFCGHGAGEAGLVLENDQGQAHLVKAEALAELLRLAQTVECVVLNACDSVVQAEAIAQFIGDAIGTTGKIQDGSACQFSEGFYDALMAGRSYKDAFEIGRNAIATANLPGTELLQLIQKKPLPISDVALVTDAELETPDGPVPIDSPFYVERSPIEADCYQEILKPGALIRVKAPQQMGKTSLMNRTLAAARAEEADCKTVLLSCGEAGSEDVASLDAFLQWFCASVADALNLEDELDERWRGRLSSKRKCSNYFQRYLFPQLSGSLVLGLDGVDRVFEYELVAKGFLELLRVWHDRAADDPQWQRFKLVLVHSMEVYVPLEINQSPFNVGLATELREFSLAQVQDLVGRHGLDLDAQVLINLLGGHPYLIRVALYELARERITWSKLVEVAPTEAGPFRQHLRRHLLNLKDHEELCEAMRQLLQGEGPVQVGDDEMFKLRSLGLVRLQEYAAELSCDLYRRYFWNYLGECA